MESQIGNVHYKLTVTQLPHFMTHTKKPKMYTKVGFYPHPVISDTNEISCL